MHSITGWSISRRPNYDNNVDKIYPYSEVPYIGQYHLVKIPLDDKLIELVDYWGEGRIVAYGMTTGFPDCYNVNHHFQCVSNGPDTGRKIPNRIPVINYTNCDTSSYIKDNSVRIVTLMGAPINKSCAQDIARMVNLEKGKVIIYGFEANTADIRNIERELSKKDILYSPDHCLDSKLGEITDSFRAYLNLTELSEDFHKSIIENKFNDAIAVSKSLHDIKKGSFIVNTVTKIIEEKQNNVMIFAYKLWTENGRQIVENYFPAAFKMIFNGDILKIVNKTHLIPLKISNDRGPNGIEDEDLWKIIPEIDSDKLYFKIQNASSNLFLKLKENDKQLIEVENTTDNTSQWSLEPLKVGDDVAYLFLNRQGNQGLTFESVKEDNGERQVLTSGSIMKDENEKYAWLILPSNSTYEYYTKKAKDRRK